MPPAPRHPQPICLHLPDEGATARLGAWLAHRLDPGTTIALSGPIGSGKSHLARAFIRARLGAEVEVPSPSFTLVQTYGEGADEVWHADLYRLSHPDEVWELGLDAAFGRAICLIEWPDRLGRALPEAAITLTLVAEGEGRRACLTLPDPAQDTLRAALHADWAAREAAP